KRAYCLKTQPATGETYPKSDLFNKAKTLLKLTPRKRIPILMAQLLYGSSLPVSFLPSSFFQ
ncbi:hypothetical protein, partial [Enterobacter asburiae]|uniref:hypothetical protein n=1 Tax=Enterobacter asburiae TaxID=61645 RepID=UPI001E5128C7